jgi:hypothetical protein
MQIVAAKCTQCGEWLYLEDFVLLWQESEGVYRGVCSFCNQQLEKASKELDWEL